MGSFGDRLRREREQRGITLEDIALTTKIRAGLLQALEEEKFDRLPGGIFNKGFVRAYARHLGLDEDQLVADYLVASGEGPVRRPVEGQAGGRMDTAEPRIQLVREEPEPDQDDGNPLNLRAILMGLLVLAIVGAVAWFYYHREKQSEAGSSSQPAAAVSPAQTAPAPASSEATAAPAVETPKKSPAPEAAPPMASNPAASVPANAVPAGAFTVRLKADEDCWVQITADGKTEEVTLDSGLEKLITARQRVTVRAGSIGALAVFFNGKRLPPQGDYGQVKTLVFGPDGLQAPKPVTAPSTTP